MCEVSKNLIFCSCQEEGSPKNLIGEHIWTLNRYVGSKESSLRGKIRGPSKDLGNGIQMEKIIEEMNARNCFDFDYVPQEKDCFRLQNGQKRPYYEYFSLIFREGKWQAGSHPAFITLSEKIAGGRIQAREE